MAVYKIVQASDELLRNKSKQVLKIDQRIHKLLDNMRDTMYEYRGVGLAAPQIGVLKRVIVIDAGDGLIEMINPEIIEAKGSEKAVEGCLSIPGVEGDVTRPSEIMVRGLNRDAEEVEYKAKGLIARIFQHEIDHLNGILFIDKAENLRKS